MKTQLLIILLAVTILIPSTTFAQMGLNDFGTGFRLLISPEHPGPNTTATARIVDQMRQQPITDIQWTINGAVQPAGGNPQTISFTTGEIGETTNITAAVRLLSGQVLQFSETVTAARLDLVVEADTITPPFYTGRSIPSLGSSIRVTAFPFETDSADDPSNFVYRWRVNNQAITGQQRSANQVIIPTNFERRIEVEVEVFTQNNTLLTKGSTAIEPSSPELIYYEIHPLRGLLPIALPEQYILTRNEILLRAEPFFMSRSMLSALSPTTWKLNNRSVSNPSSNPFEITLRRQNDSGSFTIETEVSNPERLLQSASTKMNVQF